MTGYGTWRALAVDCKGVVYVQDAEKIRRWVPPQLCGTRCSDRRRRLIDSGGGYPADDPGAIGSGVLETIIDVTASTLCYDPPCSPTPNYYHIKGLAVDDVGLDDTGGGHSNRYLYYSPVKIPQSRNFLDWDTSAFQSHGLDFHPRVSRCCFVPFRDVTGTAAT